MQVHIISPNYFVVKQIWDWCLWNFSFWRLWTYCACNLKKIWHESSMRLTTDLTARCLDIRFGFLLNFRYQSAFILCAWQLLVSLCLQKNVP